MKQAIAHVALVVEDYDEAISFYTRKLDFQVIEDTSLGNGKRWILVSPPGNSGTNLLLAKAATEQQKNAIGNQTGGRVFLFLFTDDFWRDHNKMKNRGIEFVRPPIKEPYGTVAVFSDLYGNLWDLIEPSQLNKTKIG